MPIGTNSGRFGRKNERPPHRDWVKNVFLTRMESSLAYSEKVLERLDEHERVLRSSHRPTAQAARPGGAVPFGG
jgi:hypothetical protein